MKIEDIISEIKSIEKVDIKGKAYTTVATRVEIFRKFFGFDYSINTELLVDDGKRILMKATISNKEGNVVGVGHAEEIRGSGYFPIGDKRNINTTSALENCETSCIGRALSSLSLHGGEYASINEIEIAKGKEKKLDKKPTTKYQEDRLAAAEKYVEEQMQAIQTMNPNALIVWTQQESDNLKSLADFSKNLHTKLFNAYKERNQNGIST